MSELISNGKSNFGMNGLSTINIELTSRCNKKCWMCGRRKLEREHPELCNFGDMPYELVEEISRQVPKDIVIQFHNNGEPLLYPNLYKTLELFKSNIRCFDTNGKLLIDKADEIIGNMETLTISVIEDDEEDDEQYEIVRKFIKKKGIQKPTVVYRFLGRINSYDRWLRLPGLIAKRILHAPEGSRDYEKPPTVPEIGICLDLLTHLAINRFGKVSVCVRFDPHKHGVIGDLKYHTLSEIWNGQVRKYYIDCHLTGQRNFLQLCGGCDYYGVPTS